VTDHSYCDDVYYVCAVLWWCLLSAITYPLALHPTSFWWPRIRDPLTRIRDTIHTHTILWCFTTCDDVCFYVRAVVLCCTVLYCVPQSVNRTICCPLSHMPGPRSHDPHIPDSLTCQLASPRTLRYIIHSSIHGLGRHRPLPFHYAYTSIPIPVRSVLRQPQCTHSPWHPWLPPRRGYVLHSTPDPWQVNMSLYPDLPHIPVPMPVPTRSGSAPSSLSGLIVCDSGSALCIYFSAAYDGSHHACSVIRLVQIQVGIRLSTNFKFSNSLKRLRYNF
jgi:hypothetical protein